MKNKGLVLLVKEVLESIAIVALIIFVLLLFIFTHTELETSIKENKYAHEGIVISQLLLSSPLLTAENDERFLRGVFDQEKLSSVSLNPTELYKSLSYPDSTYKLEIINLATNEKFSISSDTSGKIKFSDEIPVAIKNGNRIDPGIMKIWVFEKVLK